MVKKASKFLFISLLVLLPVVSFAQQTTQTNPGGQTTITNPGGQTTYTNPGGCNPYKEICNPLGDSTKTIPDFIAKVLEGALKVGIPLIALAIIYCGFLFVKARGNPEELTKAKDALLYTIIGAAILLGAWAIAELIRDTVLSLGK
ncbi:MAG: pilin [Patescibacteria group bacterium]